jgi:methylated-DNA-[protein]-cysteine S-methyltransferase
MAAGPEGICLLHFCGPTQPSESQVQESIGGEYPECKTKPGNPPPLLLEAKRAVLEYLTHGTPLPTLPLDMSKGTPFRRKVWKALCDIPHGETRSYLDISRAIGQPRAPRAVGQACGSNPVAILIPCHRVLAVGGKLGGYTGGLDIKAALLKLERGSG